MNGLRYKCYFLRGDFYELDQYLMVLIIIVIAPNSRARKGEEYGNVDYGGILQPGQQPFAPCIKGVLWR